MGVVIAKAPILRHPARPPGLDDLLSHLLRNDAFLLIPSPGEVLPLEVIEVA